MLSLYCLCIHNLRLPTDPYRDMISAEQHAPTCPIYSNALALDHVLDNNDTLVKLVNASRRAAEQANQLTELRKSRIINCDPHANIHTQHGQTWQF